MLEKTKADDGTVTFTFNGEVIGACKPEQEKDTTEWLVSIVTEASAMSIFALNNHIEKSYGLVRRLQRKVLDMRMSNNPDEAELFGQEFNPDTKTKSTYTSEARQKFKHDNVTEKERAIYNAIVTLGGDSLLPVPTAAVAKFTRMRINQINGAISVLLAKGTVETSRNRVGGVVQRTIRLTDLGKKVIQEVFRAD